MSWNIPKVIPKNVLGIKNTFFCKKMDRKNMSKISEKIPQKSEKKNEPKK